MDIDHIIRLYQLWRKIYPYLVSQMMAIYCHDSGNVLEMGPFSGGISLELATRYPKLRITVATGIPEVATYLHEAVSAAGLDRNISIGADDFINLSFPEKSFDLVILRGAFFFMMEENAILQNIFRVLNHGGLAIVGGGYGKDTPPEIIAEISDESRRLNDELGRARVSIDELQALIAREHLTDRCQMIEDGGIWILMRK